MTQPALGLGIGVLVGGYLQLMLQVPFLIQNGLYFWQSAPWYCPELKKIGRLMLPTVFGAAVYQINILVGTLLASLLPEGSHNRLNVFAFMRHGSVMQGLIPIFNQSLNC